MYLLTELKRIEKRLWYKKRKEGKLSKWLPDFLLSERGTSGSLVHSKHKALSSNPSTPNCSYSSPSSQKKKKKKKKTGMMPGARVKLHIWLLQKSSITVEETITFTTLILPFHGDSNKSCERCLDFGIHFCCCCWIFIQS
jgi:hypothetical protein